MTYPEIIAKELNKHKFANLSLWSMRTGSNYSDYEVKFPMPFDYKPFDINGRKVIIIALNLLDSKGGIKATAQIPVRYFKDRRKKAHAYISEAEIFDAATCELLYKSQKEDDPS